MRIYQYALFALPITLPLVGLAVACGPLPAKKPSAE